MAIGLGGYLYERTVSGNSVNFKFWDPEDTSNTAETSVSEKEFPEGVTNSEARQVADVALAKVQKQLDDKRDVRIKKEAADQLDEQLSKDAEARKATADFLSNSTEIGDTDALNVEDESKDKSDTSDGKKK